MKKLSFLAAAFAALVAMTGCSGDESSVVPNQGFTDERVPITFGMASTFIDTRGADATLTNDDSIKVGEIGVFALARGITDMNPEPLPIKWFEQETFMGMEKCECLYNVEAGKVKRDDGSDNWQMKFKEPHYYPITNFYRYEFFSYYPRVADNELYVEQKDSDILGAWVSANGYTDVLWGHLFNDKQEYAYSAKWVRDRRKEHAVDVPTMKLYHQLLRLEFFVTPGDETELPELQDICVKEISAIQVPTQMLMQVVEKNSDETTFAKILQTRGNANIAVCEDGRTQEPLKPVDIPDTFGKYVRVGSDIMLVPQEQYTLKIVLQRKSDGHLFISEYPLKIGVREDLKAGYTYKVNINVHTPVLIDLNCTIEPWRTDGNNNPVIPL